MSAETVQRYIREARADFAARRPHYRGTVIMACAVQGKIGVPIDNPFNRETERELWSVWDLYAGRLIPSGETTSPQPGVRIAPSASDADESAGGAHWWNRD